MIVNLGFPLVGGFMSELYLVVWLGGLLLVAFAWQYIAMRLVHINLFFKIKGHSKIETKG